MAADRLTSDITGKALLGSDLDIVVGGKQQPR
jgi:hypothetical protein